MDNSIVPPGDLPPEEPPSLSAQVRVGLEFDVSLKMNNAMSRLVTAVGDLVAKLKGKFLGSP